MRTVFALAVAASIVTVAPAMAQSAGFFGAPSGHNTPGSGVGAGIPNSGYNGDNYNNGWYGGYRNDGVGYGFGYDNAPGRDGYGVPNPSGAIEGRAAADDDAVVPDRMIHRHRAMMDQDDPYMNR